MNFDLTNINDAIKLILYFQVIGKKNSGRRGIKNAFLVQILQRSIKIVKIANFYSHEELDDVKNDFYLKVPKKVFLSYAEVMLSNI